MLTLRRRRTTLGLVRASLFEECRARNAGVVVVIADDRTRLAELRPSRHTPAGTRVVEMVGLEEEEMHSELSTYSGSGLLVVDTRQSFGFPQVHAFRHLFFHLDEGDVWVALRSRPVPSGKRERLVRLTRRFQVGKPGKLPKRWREHARSVAQARVTARFVMLEKGRNHLLKVRDAGATKLLNAREPDLRVTDITSMPPGTLTPANRLTDHGTAPRTRFPSELVYPEARLRRYEGRVSLPTVTTAMHGRSVLPDSFRWHASRHPRNTGVRDVDENFARSKPRPPGEPLRGSYYFFYYEHPGHYGHLMTEAVAKLWGWDQAKTEDPELKLLCREHPLRPGSAARRPERILLPAYGIDPADVVWTTGPVTVDRLYGVTPLWHNAPPYYVHPAIRDDWRRLRRGLPQAEVQPAPKIFITRTERNRLCRNRTEVEDLFAEHGFAIVHPGALTIPEQAAVFAQARVIAGFGGTGMFNLVYADELETLIVLNQSAYQARNEHLFSALLGVDSHFFWSEPDEGHDEGSYEAHQAEWEFDFGRNRTPLVDLLGNL